MNRPEVSKFSLLVLLVETISSRIWIFSSRVCFISTKAFLLADLSLENFCIFGAKIVRKNISNSTEAIDDVV
jgi:hypothetical protein